MSSCVRSRFLRSSRIRFPRAEKNFFSFITHWFLEVHEQKDHEQISVLVVALVGEPEALRRLGCERPEWFKHHPWPVGAPHTGNPTDNCVQWRSGVCYRRVEN